MMARYIPANIFVTIRNVAPHQLLVVAYSQELDSVLPDDCPQFELDEYINSEVTILEATNYCLYDFKHDSSMQDTSDKNGKKKKKKGKK